jgi:hypothetical protein
MHIETLDPHQGIHQSMNGTRMYNHSDRSTTNRKMIEAAFNTAQ